MAASPCGMEASLDFFCILSGDTCPDDQRSPEHIVPYALGGSDSFVTRDASRKANNDLGSSIDAYLMNNFVIALERWRLGIKSQNGNIPSVVFPGTIDIDGRTMRVEYTIEPDLKCSFRTIPDVSGSVATRQYSVSCAPEDLKRILGDISRKAEKHGLRLPGDVEAGGVRTTISNPTIHSHIQFSPVRFALGMAKIALGALHFELGYAWSRSTVADEIRRCLRAGEGIDVASCALIGKCFPNLASEECAALRFDDDTHAVWIPDTAEWVWVLLFGKYGAMLKLHADPKLSTTFESTGIVHLISARSRKWTRMRFIDFVDRKSSLRLH